jgi:hypothetical protein
MYKYTIVLLLFIISCANLSKNNFDAKKEIVGNWLILYPQHILKNDAQRKLYGVAQDSIVNQGGLKLVSFEKDGKFFQMDSLFGRQGSWFIVDSGRLKINSAGKGFEYFNGEVRGILNDTILIEELIKLDNERIKLIWHLKKIGQADDAAGLFQRSNNLWRQKPVKKEQTAEIKTRVRAMLEYYTLYFKIVSVESIYFSRARVFLPFTYYQHGIGLTDFATAHPFATYFYDEMDAKTGYDILKSAFEKTKDENFPSGENFVSEYSMYFERLANELK